MTRGLRVFIPFLALFMASAATSGPVFAAAEDPAYPPPPAPNLPAPVSGSAAKLAKVIGWSKTQKPKAPDGFEVSRFAGDLDAPRWLLTLSNGDVLVAQARSEFPEIMPPWMITLKDELLATGGWGTSPNQITLLRDRDKDGKADSRHILLKDLNRPFGMAVLNDWLYVAHTDSVRRYRFAVGQTEINSGGELILGLPTGGNHWTRTLVVSPDQSKLYVSVGSATNVDEQGIDAQAPLRAAILEINPDGTGLTVYASGLRNPVGLAFQPSTNVLFATVNERDQLGDDLVPDYFTSIRRGAFYGWPYAYFGSNEDPRKKAERPDLVAKSIVPDLALGGHVAALGLAFYDGESFPSLYRRGAFIAEHGSANRSSLSGYKVIFVPFADGRPGQPRDFLAGFIADEPAGQVYGRPVGLGVYVDGSLLVADDAGGIIWRIHPKN